MDVPLHLMTRAAHSHHQQLADSNMIFTKFCVQSLRLLKRSYVHWVIGYAELIERWLIAMAALLLALCSQEIVD